MHSVFVLAKAQKRHFFLKCADAPPVSVPSNTLIEVSTSLHAGKGHYVQKYSPVYREGADSEIEKWH